LFKQRMKRSCEFR